MTTLFIGTLMAIAIGALAHVVIGGNVGKLIAMLIAAVVGFWGGHLLGELGMNFVWFNIGELNALPAAVLSAICAVGTNWLMQQNPER